MRAAVMLNGTPPDEAGWQRIRDAGSIIAADGGADVLLDAGVRPHRVVGDLDGISPRSRAEIALQGIEVVRAPADKDETDGQLAVESAIAGGATEIDIFGMTGGRTAMVLANLKLLRQCAEEGCPATGWASGERMRYLDAGSAWELPADGTTLNLIPVGGATVRLSGTKWSGAISLGAGSVRGVSNPIEGAARVEVDDGAVIAIVEV